MATTRTVWGACGGLALLVAGTVGTACTDGSDDVASTTTATSTTTIPEEQKPPLLRDAWTPDDLARLAEIDVIGYQGGEPALLATSLDRTFVSDPNPDGITLTAAVHLAPCDPSTCWDIAGEPDDAHLADLQELLPPIHRNDPDLVFEHRSEEVIGDFVAFTLFYRSFVAEDAAVTGHHVLYHDGLNLIEITVAPSGATAPADDESLEALMPEDWAREVTADVFAAFADEFNADA